MLKSNQTEQMHVSNGGTPSGVWLSKTVYTVSQKKTSPTFLAITRESIDGL